MRHLIAVGALACALAGSAAADSVITTNQGFETAGPIDWNGTIQRLQSTPGLPASSGNWLALITNTEDGYATGWGDGGYTHFGLSDTTETYEGEFYQKADVYVDPAWVGGGFWLCMSARRPVPDDAYNSQHNFELSFTNSNVDVFADTQAGPFATLSSAGWYTFEITYGKGAEDSAPILSDLYVMDHSGNLLGHTVLDSNNDDYFTRQMVSGDLTGPGWLWVTLWQNGFAGNQLAIDNIQTGLVATPEPTTIAFAAAGLAIIGACARRRKLTRS